MNTNYRKISRKFIVTDVLNNEQVYDNVYDVANFFDISIVAVYKHIRDGKYFRNSDMLYKIEYLKEYI